MKILIIFLTMALPLHGGQGVEKSNQSKPKHLVANGRPIASSENESKEVWSMLPNKEKWGNPVFAFHAMSFSEHLFVGCNGAKEGFELKFLSIDKHGNEKEFIRSLDRETAHWIIQYLNAYAKIGSSGKIRCEFSKEEISDGWCFVEINNKTFEIGPSFKGTWNYSTIALLNNIISQTKSAAKVVVFNKKIREHITGGKSYDDSRDKNHVNTIINGEDFYIWFPEIEDLNSVYEGIVETRSLFK